MEIVKESQCARCGECCRNRCIGVDGPIYLDSFCPMLDLSTKLCMCYEDRHTQWARKLRDGKICLTVPTAIILKDLPRHCRYVDNRYSAKIGVQSYTKERLQQVPIIVRLGYRIWSWHIRRKIKSYLGTRNPK